MMMSGELFQQKTQLGASRATKSGCCCSQGFCFSSGNDKEARKDEKEEGRNEVTSTAAMFRGET